MILSFTFSAEVGGLVVLVEEIYLDESLLDKGGIQCPACGEELEFDFGEDEDCGCGCGHDHEGEDKE